MGPCEVSFIHVGMSTGVITQILFVEISWAQLPCLVYETLSSSGCPGPLVLLPILQCPLNLRGSGCVVDISTGSGILMAVYIAETF